MTRKNTIRIATRQSPLAIWQANHIKQALLQHHTGLQAELLPMTTSGDQSLEETLVNQGGKGLFVKELEQALLDNQADIAVHSMKDVPTHFPAALTLAVICEREDPRDAFISQQASDLNALPSHATIGTASLRRQCQIKALRPDVNVVNLRGNVNTRLAKLDAGEFDAIILAVAGLKRLNLTDRIGHYLSPETCLPAMGQGALGIECRRDDHAMLALLQILDDPITRVCVLAERAMNEILGGNCRAPIAGFATLAQGELRLRGMVGKPDGSRILHAFARGKPEAAEELGVTVARLLLAQGARDILKSC